MKQIYILLTAALLLTAFAPAHAQITNTITSQTHDQSFSMGREFWFAAPSNQWDATQGEYYPIEITSPKTTIAYVEFGGVATPVSVTANHISIFNMPLAWEMQSSGIVEDLGIHIYSNDADLSVCFLSHQEYSGEGSYVIPTIGWGTDYVVAAFASLFEGGGGEGFDYPSECVIVAQEDNTNVQITPSCDCRQCTTGSEDGTAGNGTVAFPAGKTFTVTLNQGQSLQLMPVIATDPDNFDLTGTIIHATNPVGVIGGSMETNIPLDVPYANFVCEMIPPVRTWGETYYATNFTQSSDEAVYVLIASQAGQAIHRQDCITGDHVECIISNQYGVYWDQLEGAQKFWSDAPFLVVSYSNGEGSSDGNPAEVAINPREQYTKSELFQVLQFPSNFSWGFADYANIVVNDSDEDKTLFDGKSISQNSKQCIDGNWEIFFISNISPGIHTVTGDDSGVGAYVYGNRIDESYAWSSPDFNGTFQSPDSVAPLANAITECYQSVIHLSDSGNLPNTLGVQSGLAEIRLDSESNMIYTLNANFTDGILADTSGYSMFVNDPAKPGILVVTVFDLAGNSTTITSTYAPNIVTMVPPFTNLGVWSTGNPAMVAYDTIVNEGQTTFDLDMLYLKYGKVGFSIFDSIGGPLDLSPLAPGARRIIQIQFKAVKTTTAVDSILYGNDCELGTVAIAGSGSANNFLVTSQIWPNEPITDPPTCYPRDVTIENLSSTAITIDSVWWPDQAHFKAVSTLPVTIPATPGSVQFTIDYCPDSNAAILPDSTNGRWFSDRVLTEDGKHDSVRYDYLAGWAAPLSGVSEMDNSAPEATILTANDGRSLEIILPADLDAPVTFSLVNVLGESMLRSTFSAKNQTVNASTLARGVYFYRLSSGQMSQSGKVILGD